MAQSKKQSGEESGREPGAGPETSPSGSAGPPANANDGHGGASGDRRTWPYTTGERGINRVRVYNRDDSSCIQIEWWDDRGRVQRSLRTVVGEPVTNRAQAREIADAIAKAQKNKRDVMARVAAKRLEEELSKA